MSRDDSDFTSAMRDVQPIAEPRRRSFRRSRDSREVPGKGVTFEVQRNESRVYGLRGGARKSILDDLRAGLYRSGNHLDLHGMTEEAARESVFRFIRQSRVSGLECVALVHGRGLRSPAGPVLKVALPVWLTQLPLAREVVAFGSAPIAEGGEGAMLVVLASGEETGGRRAD